MLSFNFRHNKKPPLKRGGFGALTDLLRGWSYRCIFLRELAAETLNTTCGVDHLLLAGEEGVAGCTNLNVDVALVRRTCLELCAAGALYVNFTIGGVDTLFCHDLEKTFPQSHYAIALRVPRQ